MVGILQFMLHQNVEIKKKKASAKLHFIFKRFIHPHLKYSLFSLQIYIIKITLSHTSNGISCLQMWSRHTFCFNTCRRNDICKVILSLVRLFFLFTKEGHAKPTHSQRHCRYIPAASRSGPPQ